MIEKMVKVNIVGPKKRLESVVSSLHRLKVLHITEHKKSDELDIGSPSKKAEKISRMLVEVSALVASLRLEASCRPEALGDGASIRKKLKEITKHVVRQQEELKALNERLASARSSGEKMLPFAGLSTPFEYYGGYECLVSFAGRAKDIPGLKHELHGNTMMEHAKDTLLLFADKASEEVCRTALKKHSFQALGYDPSWKHSPKQAIRDLEAEEKGIQARIARIQSSLNQVAEKSGNFLLALQAALKKELEKAEAPLKMGSTESAFFLSGWLPQARKEEVEKALAKETMHVVINEPGKKDTVPVKLRNSKTTQPFEFFMDLYSLPSYRELDPTLFLALTFPLFFGFIVGDIGYGLAGLLIAWYISKKIPGTKGFMKIIMVSSLMSLLFGVFFGEFFGEEEIMGIAMPHVLSRAHQMQELLYLAIAIGIIHINAALLIGFFNEKSHGISHAIFAKISWIILQIGVAVIALDLMGIISSSYLGYFIIGIAVLMLVKGEGINGIIELPGIFSNILSYARLMAIGLSSVSIALVINEFAAKWIEAGGLLAIGAVLLLVIGHGVNLALGYLGGFLHSLRLHYVEFFTKFFHGGGIAYRAFGEHK